MIDPILVVGDSCTDVHIYGSVERLCPEAPVPVLVPHKTVKNGGMAANVWENILSLNYPCDLLTNENEIIKTRYVDEYTNQMIVRVDGGDGIADHVDERLDDLNFNKYKAIIISDYDKGFLSYQDIQFICDNHPLVFIDTKKIINDSMENAQYIKINQFEFLTNTETWLHNNFDVPVMDRLIITLGNKGCVHQDIEYPVEPVDVKDMSGAGDTFMAGLVVEYAKSGDINKAIVFANACATVVVQHRGVTTVGDYI